MNWESLMEQPGFGGLDLALSANEGETVGWA